MSTDVTPTPERTGFFGLFNDLSITIAILLGLVSIATAYTSFQASLYDGQTSNSYGKGARLGTAAESLYLEGNQQYLQDNQLWNSLTELSIDSESTNPDIAMSASTKYDTIYFQAVSEDFGAAIERANATNEADPDFYVSPVDDEDYQDSLFSGWSDMQQEADDTIAQGDVFAGLSDRLTLNTVLMALSLFLLGIAAVVRQRRVQVIMTVTSTVIFLVALGLTVVIPFTGL